MPQNSGLCEFLEWDSSFFEKRIARVNATTLSVDDAKQIDDWCRLHEIDCLYFLAQSNDRDTIRIAEDYHYRQVDVRMIYELNLNNHENNYSLVAGFTLDTANADDLDTLLTIIDGSFNQTRFYFDSEFDETKSNELYRVWLQRSVLDGFADRVLVIHQQSKVVGFTTCKINQEQSSGEIGLVGIASEARGNKLAVALVSEALNYFQDRGLQKAIVITQGRNIAANRLYQNCGFRLSEIYLWYHKWFT